jgi:hypothetical protein
VQGGVGLSVPAPVEPATPALARGLFDGADAAERGEGCLAAQPLRVVAGCDQQGRRAVGPDPEPCQQAGRGGLDCCGHSPPELGHFLWTVTTGDGTKYVFGLNKLPGADIQRTNSVWTVPVFGDDSGEPGHDKGSSFADRSLTQAWRWNLDYVVDLHGNAMSYWYTAETNYLSTATSNQTDFRAWKRTRQTAEHPPWRPPFAAYGMKAAKAGRG